MGACAGLLNKFEVEPVVCTYLHHCVYCQFRSGFLVHCLRNISQRNAFQWECNLGKPLSVWEKPCHLSIVQIAFDPLLPSFKQALCSICSGPTFFISCKKQVPIWTWRSWYLTPPPVLFSGRCPCLQRERKIWACFGHWIYFVANLPFFLVYFDRAVVSQNLQISCMELGGLPSWQESPRCAHLNKRFNSRQAFTPPPPPPKKKEQEMP